MFSCPSLWPGKNWMDFFMRPEAEMGKVAPEPPMEPKEKEIHHLLAELHRSFADAFVKMSQTRSTG